ncbi:zinc-finger homeodomain protein 11-like [Gastrolobium bilobum]|uniref:zinc-finger homeodomain protein 11-like n=1 Tax=Gastrolobium bilobum TaxID=150636 RepID=UPI002AB0A6C9|nr:zinc-finger homeodomain protein 11-like [Gastrolobium bilobum]
MDLTSNNNQNLDADTQATPPTQPTNNNTSKSLSLTNGTHKRHPTTTAPPPQPPSMVVSYKECLKNHAASIGGHALDGCGEFMPPSSINHTDPRSLKCAACGCHRNFHRRDPQEHSKNPTFLSCFYSPSATAPPQPQPPLPSSPSPPPLSHLPPSYHTSAPHMLLALGTAFTAPSDEQHHRNLNSSSLVKPENPSGKKRYRTKFSKDQKEKMHSFSEKLGWRMQKGDDGLVQEFCNNIGVSKGVFKVWMHNNKNNFRKRSEDGNVPQTEKINGDDDDDDGGNDGRSGRGGGGFDSDINNPYNTNSSNNDIHRNEDGCVDVHVSINGLSS